MSIKEQSVPVRFCSESPKGVGHVVLEVGGVDIATLTRNVVIRSSVGQLSTVELEVLALGGLDVTLPAAVIVNMIPMEEGDIEVTTLPDSTLRYRFTRKRDVSG